MKKTALLFLLLALTLAAAGATKLRCVGHDYDRHTVKLMAIGHALT